MQNSSTVTRFNGPQPFCTDYFDVYAATEEEASVGFVHSS